MAPMRQQPALIESWTEAEALGLMRRLSGVPRRPRAEPTALQERRAVLTRTVEEEVIPRLLMAQRPQQTNLGHVNETPAQDVAPAAILPNENRVAELVDVVLNGTQSDTTAYVEAVRDGGASTESVFLDLLTPTARQLGVLWENDDCSFSDVTIGLSRLGNVLRLLSRAFAGNYQPQRIGPSALLVQMPGEQHGFGLAMVVQFFRRAGWNVRQENVVTSADLVSIAQSEWFGVVGISVACTDRMETLAADIRSIRKLSRNRRIGIMVGGPPFLAHPQLATMVGADATAIDGRQAVQQAQSLISLLARDN